MKQLVKPVPQIRRDCPVDAREALPVIEHAFAEHRVDESIIDLYEVLVGMGMVSREGELSHGVDERMSSLVAPDTREMLAVPHLSPVMLPHRQNAIRKTRRKRAKQSRKRNRK